MKGPDELVFVLIELQERNAHQRNIGQLKPAPAVGQQKLFKLLVALVYVSPVVHRERYFDMRLDHLCRRFNIFPLKAAAQDCVVFNQLLPGTLKSLNIQSTYEVAAHLVDPDTCAVAVEAIENDVPLGVRDGIRGFTRHYT